MKNLKNNIALYNDMTRLINSVGDDETRVYLQGIYCTKDHLISTDGYTLFVTSRTPIFEKCLDGIVDIKPIAKTFSLEHFKTYNLKIGREYPRIDYLLEADKKNKNSVKIILPSWIKNLKNSKDVAFIYFDGETFTFEKTEKTKFCIDLNKLKRIFPLDCKDCELTMTYGEGLVTFQDSTKDWKFIIAEIRL